MADLRDDLLRLAEEFERRSKLTTAELCRVTKQRLLAKCAADVRALLASHPAPSPSVSRDAEEALEKCMAVLRWHLGMFQRKDEPMMLVALESGERALGRRERLVPPAFGAGAPSPRSEAESGTEMVTCLGKPEPHPRGLLCVDPSSAPVPAESATKEET